MIIFEEWYDCILLLTNMPCFAHNIKSSTKVLRTNESLKKNVPEAEIFGSNKILCKIGTRQEVESALAKFWYGLRGKVEVFR